MFKRARLPSGTWGGFCCSAPTSKNRSTDPYSPSFEALHKALQDTTSSNKITGPPPTDTEKLGGLFRNAEYLIQVHDAMTRLMVYLAAFKNLAIALDEMSDENKKGEVKEKEDKEQKNEEEEGYIFKEVARGYARGKMLIFSREYVDSFLRLRESSMPCGDPEMLEEVLREVRRVPVVYWLCGRHGSEVALRRFDAIGK